MHFHVFFLTLFYLNKEYPEESLSSSADQSPRNPHIIQVIHHSNWPGIPLSSQVLQETKAIKTTSIGAKYDFRNSVMGDCFSTYLILVSVEIGLLVVPTTLAQSIFLLNIPSCFDSY